MRDRAAALRTASRARGRLALSVLSAGLWASVGFAQPDPALLGDASVLRIGILDLDAGAGQWPMAIAALGTELRARTSLEPAAEARLLRIADGALFATPFVVLSGTRAFALPQELDLARLRRFLVYGGFLLIDDAAARPGGAFDHSARQLVRALLPTLPLAPLSPDHVLFKSFYLLDGPAGRVLAAPALEAVEQDGRLLVVHSSNDLGTALAARQEQSVRLAVNLVLYALCLDYKEDQVHMPFILRRTRSRGRP